MDQVKSNFFENQILEAIETVANGIVSKIKFDQTILCTITNDEKRKKGIYEVTDGTSTFEACSNDDSYKEDMIVYVLIPQGDYENQKTIIGKYVDDTSSAINYISMMDSFIAVNGSSNAQEYSLIANHPDRKFINIPIDVDYLKETNQYNCVGIQADFKTDLSQEHIIAGNYGLVLTLYGEDASTAQPIPPKSYALDCSEMYGDPYNYNFYFTQSMVFDLAKDFANTKITNATISFYQNKNFKTLDNEELSYTYSTTHTYIDENGTGQKEEIISREKQPNLFVKNVVLKFGYNLSDITEESIRLYSLNDTKYISRSDKKNISLKWFVKNEVEEKLPYLIIDNKEEAAANKNLTSDYSIYWYRYKIDNSAKDPLAGVYWNIIPKGIHNNKVFLENKKSEKNELIYVLEENPEGKYAKVNDAEDGALILATPDNEIKYDVKIYSEKRYNGTESKDPFTYTFGPNELLSREKIKAILVRNEWKEVLTEGKGDDDNIYVHFEDASKYYESNELVYENANPASQNLASVDLIRNMRLECQDGSNGIYKVYNGVDNKALGNEANRIRILNVIFDTYSTIDIPTAELENCSVKWKIPKNNSMIEPVDFSFTGPVVIQNPNNENEIKEDNKSETTIITWKTEEGVPYYECSYSWSSDIVGKDEHYEGVSLQANYRIKEDYSQAYNNNTIICEITKYNRIYKAEIEFLFGESGTNGTGYTLSIRLDKEYDSSGNVSLTPVSCITADTNKKVKLVATLFDQFGNDISNQQTVSWSFKNGKNKGLVLNSDYIKYDGTKAISECYGIIMATSTVKWKEKTINLQAYLPIGIKPQNSDIFTYNGTTKIIYDAQGTQSTYQQIHNLYDKEDKDISVNKWQVSVLDQKADENWNEYIPYFVKETTEDSEESTNILAAKNMYFTELSTKQIVIQALDDKDNVLYQQSILYDQNRFGSALFNEWDGSLVIDKTENKILSALIGAGKKETNNTFSGVLIGDFTKNGSTKTGLLGFKNSLETFGFHTDGTAFIGPSGQGRIEFDGTRGIIQSYTGNTKLNLTTGEIYLANDDEKSAKIILDSTGDSGYFSIKDKANDKNLIYIGPTGYYLQSKNFEDSSSTKKGTGVKFDLKNGKLTGYDFLITAKGTNGTLIIDSADSEYPLKIGTNFKVDWDGKMEATGGTFKDITASSGEIGGWTIVSNALYYGNKDGHQFNETTNYLTSFKTGANRAFFAPEGIATTNFKYSTTTYEVTTDVTTGTYTGTKTDNHSNDLDSSIKILFNVGKNFAIAVDGTVYANALYLKDYAKTKDLITLSNNAFAGINKNISSIGSINNEIDDMNKQYGSIIKVSGTDKTNTYMTKGGSYDGVTSGYFFEGNFYSDAEHKTLMNKKNNYVYVDISTGDTYSCNGSKYIKNNDIKFFTVSTKGLLTANNAVISGTIYATNGWFSGGISASEGHFGNWKILKTGQLKGTPSDIKAGYEIILNPNYEVSNAKKTFYYTHTWEVTDTSTVPSEDDTDITGVTTNSKKISFEIKASDDFDDMKTNFVNAIHHQANDWSFEWENLPLLQQIILMTQFIFLKSTLIDNNIFTIKNTDNSMIFGIDGNGFLNWRFYKNNSFSSEESRFIIQTDRDSLNIGWADLNADIARATWSFTSDGNLSLSKLKSTSYQDNIGGFQLYGEDASDKFWNNSFFTTNTINTGFNKYSHYVSFLRAVGSSSKSLANAFIGCKQYDNNTETWPSNNDWSSNANYNFYIRFDGKAKFKTLSTDTLSTDTLSTDTLSTKRINAAIPGITAASQGRDYALIRLTSSSGKYSYYRPLFSLQGITSGKSWDFGINPRKDATEDSQYQYVDELFLCGFSSYAYSNRGKASFSLGIGRKWASNTDNDGSISGYNYIVPRTNIKLGTSNFRWKEIWSDTELNTSSDIRLKEVQDDNYLRKLLIVYNNIKPIAYKKKNIKPEDNHDRIHIGFSAQNVELELSKVSLTSMDFAGLGIDPTNDPFFEDGKQYSLRYGEFHGLHVLKNQEQDKRILELEQKVQYLENKILELSEKGV